MTTEQMLQNLHRMAQSTSQAQYNSKSHKSTKKSTNKKRKPSSR